MCPGWIWPDRSTRLSITSRWPAVAWRLSFPGRGRGPSPTDGEPVAANNGLEPMLSRADPPALKPEMRRCRISNSSSLVVRTSTRHNSKSTPAHIARRTVAGCPLRLSAPLPQQLSASRNHLSRRAVMDSYESRSFPSPEAEYSHTSTKAL